MKYSGVLVATMIVVCSIGAWAESSVFPQDRIDALLSSGDIDEALAMEMGRVASGEMISCIVLVGNGYPHSLLLGQSPPEKIRAYRGFAEQGQEAILARLQNRSGAEVLDRYWITNALHLRATPAIIEELALLDEIRQVILNGEVHLVETTPSPAPLDRDRTNEWGIEKIQAHECWAQGFSGEGVIVGHTDTGVDANHPAIQGKFAGYWYDAINGQSSPYDDHGHGTHTMGTMVGGDGPGSFGNDIGVAYGATWISAKMLNASGSGSFAQCLDGMEFIADCKEETDVKVMSASWSGGASNPTDTFFFDVCSTYKNIDILPVFANGNDGPGSGTVGVPANYPHVMGVGATDSGDNIAGFSSRGPAPNIHPWSDTDLWFRPDWNYIKPDISAPGASVRSCVPGGGYDTWNGTSMATPHVAATTALLCQKNPALGAQQLYDLLQEGVDLPGSGSYPNNNYGWGRLNALNSLNLVPAPNQPWLVTTREFFDGDGDGLFEAGEDGDLVLTVKNIGGAEAYNAEVQVLCSDNYLSVENGYFFAGDLPTDSSASNEANPVRVFAHALTPPGHQALLDLYVHADGDSLGYSDTLSIALVVGNPPPPLTIFEEDFEYEGGDSFGQHWNAGASWSWTSQDSHSPGHSAYGGWQLDEWRRLVQSEGVDLSYYANANPRARFWHKFNIEYEGVFTQMNTEISLNGGMTWSSIWNYAFYEEGGNIPWSEKTVSFGGQVSDDVRIRFNIRSDFMFMSYDHWYIDDYEIVVDDDQAPPYFHAWTELGDSEDLGPFPVSAELRDQSGVGSAWVVYRVGGGDWTELEMGLVGQDLYEVYIPELAIGGLVEYYYRAEDAWVNPNAGNWPLDAPADVFSFQAGNMTGTGDFDLANSFRVESRLSEGRANFHFAMGSDAKVELDLFNVLGRRVRSFEPAQWERGEHVLAWDGRNDRGERLSSGIYFARFHAGGFKSTKRVVLLR